MLEELSSKDKVVGLKQVQRAVSAGRAGRVFLACDADPWAGPAASTWAPPPRRCWQRKNRFQRNKILCSVENIGSHPTNL